MEYSPINPSDLGQLFGGTYDENPPTLPRTLGIEGSGTVVATGGGLMTSGLLGKRVAVSTTYGTWAEYSLVPAAQAFPLPDAVDFVHGANFFVNPLTVLSFAEIIEAGGHSTVINTAGASQLGKMLIRMGKANNFGVIAVVRKQSQVAELKQLGALEVVVMDDTNETKESEGSSGTTVRPAWSKELKEICKKYNTKLALEAISGDVTGHVTDALRPGGVCLVYSNLSMKPASGIAPKDLFALSKRVEGYLLPVYLQQKSLWAKWRFIVKAKKNVGNLLSTDIAKTVPLERAVDAISEYQAHWASAGKIMLSLGENRLKSQE